MVKRKIKKIVENKSKSSMNWTSKVDKNKMTNKSKSHTSLMEQIENPVIKTDNVSKDNKCAYKIPKKTRTRNKTLINTKKEQAHKIKPDIVTKDPIISKFERETGEVQKRCQILSKKIDNWLGLQRKRKCKVFTNEYVQYSTVIRDSKKMTIRKKIDEVIIHEYLPLPEKSKSIKGDCKYVIKSDDLLRPVANTSQQNNFQGNELYANISNQKADDFNASWCQKERKADNYNATWCQKLQKADDYNALSYQTEQKVDDYNALWCQKEQKADNYNALWWQKEQKADNFNALWCQKLQKADDNNALSPCESSIPKLTYESHGYTKDPKVRPTRHEICKDVIDNDRRFISHVSQDNFISPKKRKKETHDDHFKMSTKKHIVANKSNFIKFQNYKQSNELQSSYSIQSAETSSKLHDTPDITPIQSDIRSVINLSNIGSTYTIIDSDKPTINDVAPKMNIENEINSCNLPETYSVEELHVSQFNIDHSINNNNDLVKNVTPDVCGTFYGNIQTSNYNTKQCFKLSDLRKEDEIPKICETYCIEASLSYVDKYTGQLPEIQEIQDSLNRNISTSFQEANNFNVIFISNSQQSNTETNKLNIHTDIDPLRVCETIFDHQDTYENEEYNFIFNSINDISNKHNDDIPSDLCKTELRYIKQQDRANILNADWANKDVNEEINTDCNAIELNNFNFKNRQRFVPKGRA